ncbi:MAG: hypothetical protein ACYTF1_00210 [Planctomycetota bacterium]
MSKDCVVDRDWLGCRKAVDEYFADRGPKFRLDTDGPTFITQRTA